MKEKTLYTFIGRTASGKSALAKAFCEKNGLVQVRSYATRPMRPGEEVHADHIFIKPEEVDAYRDDMAAYTKIGDYEYFTTWDQLMQCDVYVIDPIGYYDLRDKIQTEHRAIKLVPVYVHLMTGIRKQRALDRGDDIEVFEKRNEDEKEQFIAFERDVKNIQELILLDNSLNMEYTLTELASKIIWQELENAV